MSSFPTRHVLAVVSNNAARTRAAISLPVGLFVFFGYFLSSATAGSQASSTVKFLRALHTAFHRGCPSLRSHQQGTRVPFSPRPRQPLLFGGLLMKGILTGVKRCLVMVSMCISLVVSDAEHLFSCVCWSSDLCVLFGDVSDQVLCVFFNWTVWVFCFLFFFMLSGMSSLWIFEISPVLAVPLTTVFSNSGGPHARGTWL